MSLNRNLSNQNIDEEAQQAYQGQKNFSKYV
jgi:hypothetical protein